MKRKCSIRGLIRNEGYVVNNISVPYRLKLLNRSSTSILLRTISSTLLNTTTLNSVNGRFPSASRQFTNTGDFILLRGMITLLTRGKFGTSGVSTAVVTRIPGVTPCVSRVHTGVTGTYKVSASYISIGTAARRGLNFANTGRNVTTRYIYLVRGTWTWGRLLYHFFVTRRWCVILGVVCRWVAPLPGVVCLNATFFV